MARSCIRWEGPVHALEGLCRRQSGCSCMVDSVQMDRAHRSYQGYCTVLGCGCRAGTLYNEHFIAVGFAFTRTTLRGVRGLHEETACRFCSPSETLKTTTSYTHNHQTAMPLLSISTYLVSSTCLPSPFLALLSRIYSPFPKRCHRL